MRLLTVVVMVVPLAGCTADEAWRNVILPEQRVLDVHDPARLPAATLPDIPPPRTVADPRPGTQVWALSLDEAIKIALENARVVRVLSGVTAVNSGQTIYDAAVTNTTIDQEQGKFDPNVSEQNQWERRNTPAAGIDPANPFATVITSTPFDDYRSIFGLTKTNLLGGSWALNWTENPTRFPGVVTGAAASRTTSTGTAAGTTTGLTSGFLNPQNPNSVSLSYTQPLLQGAGVAVNVAPIVIARLNTERSYFQLKDSVQELVRGVIEAYWTLVQARTTRWARDVQVNQAKEAYEREQARLKAGFADLSGVAQARVTYNQFRANLIAAEAAVLTAEGALRNLLGLLPEDQRAIVPVSAPTTRRLSPDWDPLVKLAEARRPDIVELKLIVEADRQRLLQAENQALPKLDASALYRWNGLDGTAPTGERLSTAAGQYTDWTIGLNFSVPLGLRAARAQVRQQRLMIERDLANVDQSIHAAVHELALTARNLESAYAQYLAYKETRAAADENLKVQIEQFRAGRIIYLNVLQALNDFGNAVSSEAQALLSYNTELARLERQTGTILETHGLVFAEERFRAAGPIGLPGHCRDYPLATVPHGQPDRYPGSGEPAENSFDLRNPSPGRDSPGGDTPAELPPPRPLTP